MFKFSPPPASTPFCTHAHKQINVVSYHALKSFPSKKIRRGVQRWAPDQTCPPRLGGSGGGSAGPEWWGSSRRLGAWTTQPRRNGATLASCWQRLSYVYKKVPDLDPLVSYRLLTTSCRKLSKIELTSLKQSIVINTDEMFYYPISPCVTSILGEGAAFQNLSRSTVFPTCVCEATTSKTLNNENGITITSRQTVLGNPR